MGEVWVDPGIGFGKTAAHNLALLRHLPELVADGLPVLVGTSRKSFLGRLASGPAGEPAARGRPACRAPSPPPPGPCWRARRWSGSTTCRARCEAATLVGATRLGRAAPPGGPDRAAG